MTETFEFTLNNPLTEEQWDMIADVDFDHTTRIWFNTKHGKEVEFTKVIRCKECKHFLKARSEDEYDSCSILFEMQDVPLETDEDKYCAWAERKNRECDTCPEYKDYHCEKWCTVIRQTIADMEEDWIPIYWIEEWLNKYPNMSDGSKSIVRMMMNDWQKEKETQNDKTD